MENIPAIHIQICHEITFWTLIDMDQRGIGEKNCQNNKKTYYSQIQILFTLKNRRLATLKTEKNGSRLKKLNLLGGVKV